MSGGNEISGDILHILKTGKVPAESKIEWVFDRSKRLPGGDLGKQVRPSS